MSLLYAFDLSLVLCLIFKCFTINSECLFFSQVEMFMSNYTLVQEKLDTVCIQLVATWLLKERLSGIQHPENQPSWL